MSLQSARHCSKLFHQSGEPTVRDAEITQCLAKHVAVYIPSIKPSLVSEWTGKWFWFVEARLAGHTRAMPAGAGLSSLA